MSFPAADSPIQAISPWTNQTDDGLMTTAEREPGCLVTKRPLSAIVIRDGAEFRGKTDPFRCRNPGVRPYTDPRLVEVRWGKRHLAVFAIDLADGTRQR